VAGSVILNIVVGRVVPPILVKACCLGVPEQHSQIIVTIIENTDKEEIMINGRAVAGSVMLNMVVGRVVMGGCLFVVCQGR
jgi:hypothetical protein